VTTPGQGVKALLGYLASNYAGGPKADKVQAFLDGVAAVRSHVGPFAIDDTFTATLPGLNVRDVDVYVGGPGAQATPIIAFLSNGEVRTGSLQASMGMTPAGVPVFNPFRSNLIVSERYRHGRRHGSVSERR
jgi:hypothetical protein